MANHLMILANGLVVKLMAKKRYGIVAELVTSVKPNKVDGGKIGSILTFCPKLRHLEFSTANTNAFDKCA
jgi:hypothetical protein